MFDIVNRVVKDTIKNLHFMAFFICILTICQPELQYNITMFQLQK